LSLAAKPKPFDNGRLFIWDAHRWTPLATDPVDDAEKHLVPQNRNFVDLSTLFSFAPGGVYHAASISGRAVRSYRTLSPLPAC